jgi:hypothetical protein
MENERLNQREEDKVHLSKLGIPMSRIARPDAIDAVKTVAANEESAKDHRRRRTPRISLKMIGDARNG